MGIAVDTQPDTNQEEQQKDITEKWHSSDQTTERLDEYWCLFYVLNIKSVCLTLIEKKLILAKLLVAASGNSIVREK